MKLSTSTINLLKNFASINVNLFVDENATKIVTRSSRKTILCRAFIKDGPFPKEFGIYDLNNFLGALSLFESPDVSFGDLSCVISEENDKRKKLTYYYSEKKSLTVSTTDEIPMNDADIQASFILTADTLKTITRSAALMKLDSIAIGIDDDRASIGAETKSSGNEVSNTYSVDISPDVKRGAAFNESFVTHFDTLNINPIGNIDYKVTITKSFMRLDSVTGSEYDITYWYAPKSKS